MVQNVAWFSVVIISQKNLKKHLKEKHKNGTFVKQNQQNKKNMFVIFPLVATFL